MYVSFMCRHVAIEQYLCAGVCFQTQNAHAILVEDRRCSLMATKPHRVSAVPFGQKASTSGFCQKLWIVQMHKQRKQDCSTCKAKRKSKSDSRELCAFVPVGVLLLRAPQMHPYLKEFEA